MRASGGPKGAGTLPMAAGDTAPSTSSCVTTCLREPLCFVGFAHETRTGLLLWVEDRESQEIHTFSWSPEQRPWQRV